LAHAMCSKDDWLAERGIAHPLTMHGRPSRSSWTPLSRSRSAPSRRDVQTSGSPSAPGTKERLTGWRCRTAAGKGEHSAQIPSRQDRAVHRGPRRLFLRQAGKSDRRDPRAPNRLGNHRSQPDTERTQVDRSCPRMGAAASTDGPADRRLRPCLAQLLSSQDASHISPRRQPVRHRLL
jgi:hypothetical protein